MEEGKEKQNVEISEARERYNLGGIQHWHLMWLKYREAWHVGNITKYVLRYRAKGGLRDLRAALDYLEDLIRREEEEAKWKGRANEEQTEPPQTP